MNELFDKEKAAEQQPEQMALDARELALINQYTLREMSAGELFTFKAVACDNEVDRQTEAFNERTLKQMRDLIIGKTVISNHENSAQLQCARIYAARVARDPVKLTSYGEPYAWLEVRCYMPRSPETQAEITAIEAGIRKEMSIRYGVARELCSICGKNFWSTECRHNRGEIYEDGKKCFVIQDDARSVAELSFVAVPAQPAAGVTKGLKESTGFGKQMEEILDAVKSLAAEIREHRDNDAIKSKALPVAGSENASQQAWTACDAQLLREARELVNKTLNG